VATWHSVFLTRKLLGDQMLHLFVPLDADLVSCFRNVLLDVSRACPARHEKRRLLQPLMPRRPQIKPGCLTGCRSLSWISETRETAHCVIRMNPSSLTRVGPSTQRHRSDSHRNQDGWRIAPVGSRQSGRLRHRTFEFPGSSCQVRTPRGVGSLVLTTDACVGHSRRVLYVIMMYIAV
jgi:hypothetical protein